MVWHITDLAAPDQRTTKCILRGYNDTMYRLTYDGNLTRLQRIRGEGIIEFEKSLPMGGERVHGTINVHNTMAFLSWDSQTRLVLSLVSAAGTLLWSQELVGPNQWLTAAIFIDEDRIYVGASFEGTFHQMYHSDGVALAYTLNGELYWDEKLLQSVGGVQAAGDSVYFAGIADGGDISVQIFSRGGKRGVLSITDNMGVHNLQSALLDLQGRLHVCGLVALGATWNAFHVIYDPCADQFLPQPLTAVATTHPSDVVVDLVVQPQRVLLHLAVDGQGSWLVHSGIACHHFTDTFERSGPLAYGGEVISKGGSFFGDFRVDKVLYEPGIDAQIGYVMTFRE